VGGRGGQTCDEILLKRYLRDIYFISPVLHTRIIYGRPLPFFF
jgi:hypothetical protein